MSLKQFKIVKMTLVVILAMVFSQAIVFKSFLIPVVLLIASSLAIFYLRSRVKEVIADERDYLTGGKSALWAMQIYAWVAVVAMLVLYANRDLNPAYEPVAMTLAFSTCILLLLYALIFRYYNKIKLTDKKTIYVVLVLIFFLALAVFSLRVFSGEDNWLCQNGEWIKHGQPDFPAPAVGCK
ncbi:MAG: DUF2178 domain-containing protein [Patescibacteria group bacterium]|nr:DUF2178 domain-containing protein [Patescibacteria group bacterium]